MRQDVRGATLQLYDPQTRVGVLAGMGRTGSAGRAGRLVLFVGGRRVALFTGEEGRDPGLGVPPLHIERTADELSLTFDGPVLALEDGRYYLDVEDAMARSQLADVHLDVHCRVVAASDHGPAFARVDGEIVVDRHAARLRTARVLQPGCAGPHDVGAAHDAGGQLRGGRGTGGADERKRARVRRALRTAARRAGGHCPTPASA